MNWFNWFYVVFDGKTDPAAAVDNSSEAVAVIVGNDLCKAEDSSDNLVAAADDFDFFSSHWSHKICIMWIIKFC